MLSICFFPVMFLIMLFGITANASIIFIILMNKLIRLQPTNLFLLNMALSDFLNLCLCPILYIFKRDVLFVNYYLPKFCCLITPFLTGKSLVGNMFIQFHSFTHNFLMSDLNFYFSHSRSK